MAELMNQKLRSSVRVFLSIVLVLCLGSCSAGGSAGLEPFQSPDGRYGFLFPTGWTRVQVSGGPAVVFHDLINSDETLSLVVSEVSNEVDLENIGTSDEIGQKLFDQVILSEDTSRKIELVETKKRESSDHVFYDLEYTMSLPQQTRHELATITLDRGYLYTFVVSTNENRWPKVQGLFERVVSSFTFLI